MPPYALPDEKTKSTIKTNSSVGGEGFNEIRFEDLKDEEEIFIHAQKNLDMRILEDRKELVRRDRHLVVERNKVEQVDEDRHAKIAQDDVVELGRDHHLKVGGKQAIEVGQTLSLKVQGDVAEAFQGKHSIQVTGDCYIKGANVVIEGMSGVTIKVGGNFVNISSAGIDIVGSMVKINSGGSALSGSAGSIVSPTAPMAALVAGTALAGQDPTYDAPSHVESTQDSDDEEAHWIEIELVDENDNPVAGERYRVTLPDGETIARGTTGPDGVARIGGISEAGNCLVTFPNLDTEAWEII
jgi:type VI secretion system secreted protein VgrG